MKKKKKKQMMMVFELSMMPVGWCNLSSGFWPLCLLRMGSGGKSWSCAVRFDFWARSS
jgi:hypothetical protein